MTTQSTNLWGGRFTEKPDETFRLFNESFSFDRRLFAADVRASIAHANGLSGGAILTSSERDEIIDALRSLLDASRTEKSFFDADAEDVHSFIETKLIGLIGETGKKLHTGRSRNDQVATAFRIWLREEIDSIVETVIAFQQSLLDVATRHAGAIIPGYTHLQRAQPILWPHWCLAYFEMLSRDRERLTDVRRRVNVMPLGSAALAGTSFPIDREAVARELGFEGISRNSLDAVSDRDFAVEFAGGCAVAMVHLSRMAEDLILYCSTEFGFVTLSDAVSTGSSLMPQKKNPDSLELIRGKAGRVFGHHAALLATMKGLPLAYNKDMQEDKEAVFDTVDTVLSCIRVGAIVLDNLTVNEKLAREAASRGFLNATELADYLVKKGMPFRSAHDIVGQAVLFAAESDRELEKLSLEEFRRFSEAIDNDVFDVLSLQSTVDSKSQTGGTSRARVAEALDAARQSLERGANGSQNREG